MQNATELKRAVLERLPAVSHCGVEEVVDGDPALLERGALQGRKSETNQPTFRLQSYGTT